MTPIKHFFFAASIGLLLLLASGFFFFDLQSTSFLCLSCLFLSGLFPSAQPSLSLPLYFLTKVVADVLITKLFFLPWKSLLCKTFILFLESEICLSWVSLKRSFFQVSSKSYWSLFRVILKSYQSPFRGLQSLIWVLLKSYRKIILVFSESYWRLIRVLLESYQSLVSS